MVLRTGWDLDYVRDMDVLTFNTVTAVVTKLVYRERIEDAWVRMIAAQGEKKSMETLTGAWRSAIGEDLTPEKQPASAAQGAVAFLKALKIDPARGGRF